MPSSEHVFGTGTLQGTGCDFDTNGFAPLTLRIHECREFSAQSNTTLFDHGDAVDFREVLDSMGDKNSSFCPQDPFVTEDLAEKAFSSDFLY